MNSQEKYATLGIDIGSTTVKIAILDEEHNILFSDYERHFANIRETLSELLKKAYDQLGELQLHPMITGSGGLTLANALMSVIISFLIFSQIQSAGSGVSALRLVGSSIDHANQVDGIPEMDQNGAARHPDSHDIVFDHVDFSYGSRPILKDVSLTIRTGPPPPS